MAWDKHFLQGLQIGADIGLQRKKMQAEQTYKQWQMQKEQAQLSAFQRMFGEPSPGTGGIVPPISTTSPQIGGVGNASTQYLKVPDFNSPLGFRVEVNPAFKMQEQANIKGEAETRKAQLKAGGNFARVASAVKQFSDYYANSLKEGGSGNIIAKQKGKIATQMIGGSMGEAMPETGKLFGQRAELSLSMMPILTNQNRFIASIMEYINKSLPQGQEGASLAMSKLEQTLLNQYATAQALRKLGYDPDVQDDVERIDQMGDDEAAGLAKKVIGLAQGYKLTKEEKKELSKSSTSQFVLFKTSEYLLFK